MLLIQSSYLEWVRPNRGWIKVNCDVVWSDVDSSCGIGCFARDSDGLVVGWSKQFVSAVASPVDAECLAI